jgi:hypothetical protein
VKHHLKLNLSTACGACELEARVRLNTDGSCRDGGHIGCGGIIKGSDGEWL